MSRSPFVKVYVKATGRDLSGLIEGFKYEDAIEKDSLMTFNIKKGYALEAADDEDIISGKSLTCQFGFLGESVSTVHVAKITDVDVTYGERVTMVVKCLDKGQDMKKSTPSKMWKGKKASDIAKEVAEKYGLTPIVDETSRTYDSLPQGQKTDFEFLQYLASKEKDGSYIFYVSDEELHFEKVNYSVSSRITFTYGVDVVKFSPKFKESEQKGGGKSSTVKSFDPMNKKASDTTVTPTTAVGSKLGEWDVNGSAKSSSTLGAGGINSQSLPAGKTDFKGLVKSVTDAKDLDKKGENETTNVILPTKNTEEGKDAANKLQKTGGNPGKGKSGGSKILTATLDIAGNPLLKPGDIITMAGVAKRHQGNWYVEKVSHTITAGSAYTTSLEMHKNGTGKSNTKDSEKSDDVNKTVGDKTGSTSKTIASNDVHWNQDGSGKRVIPNG